jgi:hypothetical protein
VANAAGWQQRGQRGNSEQLPLERTDAPGIYRRGSRYVVVYRVEGRQRKQYVGTLAEARAIKLERDGEAQALRRGATLHGFSLSWLDRYAGTGHDMSEKLPLSDVSGRHRLRCLRCMESGSEADASGPTAYRARI